MQVMSEAMQEVIFDLLVICDSGYKIPASPQGQGLLEGSTDLVRGCMDKMRNDHFSLCVQNIRCAKM
jgi:hypothetical protein